MLVCWKSRVVNEIHSSSTKKNKEWQKKLPVVVLKAEEIMYSKANSEVIVILSLFQPRSFLSQAHKPRLSTENSTIEPSLVHSGGCALIDFLFAISVCFLVGLFAISNPFEIGRVHGS